MSATENCESLGTKLSKATLHIANRESKIAQLQADYNAVGKESATLLRILEIRDKQIDRLKLQISAQKEDGCIISVGGLVSDIEQMENNRIQQPEEITDVRLKAVGNLSFLLSIIRCNQQLSEQEEVCIYDLIEELKQDVIFSENKIQKDKDWWSARASELKQIPEFCKLAIEFEEHEAQLSYQDAIVPFIQQITQENKELKEELVKYKTTK
jgi:hypothetical protein